MVIDNTPIPDPAWQSDTMSALSQVDEPSIVREPAAKLRELFRNVDEEIFKDGMSSKFSTALCGIISEYGIVAVKQLEKMTLARDAPVDIAEEVLRQVGHIRDTVTHDARLTLLERALESPELYIRDGAAIGIESMGDPRAVPSLERALEHETYEWLSQYIQDVIVHLRMHNEISEDH